MSNKRRSEETSLHSHLESKSIMELLKCMNEEDQKVAIAVQSCFPVLSELIECIIKKMKQGGRLFYIGAGTSGRLGILDASECPPTFGVPKDLVNGIIAGGDQAIRTAVEFAEDNTIQAWLDLEEHLVGTLDVVIGIAASGSTPYVVHGLKDCQLNGVTTACITSNPGSSLTAYANYKIEVELGPEFITGSTRLKSGTAQKMILNMISTSCMIGLGRVVDNKMVDMQLSNDKLIQRGVRMIIDQTQLDELQARNLLLSTGSVRLAIQKFKNS